MSIFGIKAYQGRSNVGIRGVPINNDALMKGKAVREEVEISASLEKTGESVSVWRGVSGEHGGVGEKNVGEGAFRGKTVDHGVV